jgi:Bax protein
MPHARFERWALVGLGLCVAGLYAGAALSPVAPVPRLGAPDGGMATAVEGDARPASARNGVELGKPAAVMTVGSTEKLSDMFSDLGYHLDRVRGRDDVVPRVFLASLPRDLKRARSVDTRKRVFLKAILPLVLKVNESILLERGRLLALRQRAEAGRELTPAARIWLEDLARRYGVETLDFDELLRRVDAIPPGLALAQGAEESGWGTSRFALEGNAPFGQWTFDPDEGIVPERRDNGKSHLVRAYDHLLDGVWAYSLNLNTHPAYRGFRRMRADMRRTGRELDGYALAGTLMRYSERGKAYIESIRTIMRVNDLTPLDHARLRRAMLANLITPER